MPRRYLGRSAASIAAVLCGLSIAATTPAAIAQSGQPSITTTGTQQSPIATARDFRDIVQEATSNVFPAVVYIRCVMDTHESGKRIAMETSGSGVIVSPTGEVVTNWHVIDNAVSIRCLLSDGRACKAELIGSDKTVDLAVLQLELAPDDPAVPFASFGDSDVVTEGDFVMAMGAPWGLNRSVSIGIISCTRRYLPEVSDYSRWLQTDAAINPGNSGGPLVNTLGKVIGINTRGMSGSDGMGFAVPSNVVAEIVPQIRDYGEVQWSWSGLQLQPLRDFDKDIYFDATEGVIIADVEPESPAIRAGLQPRDRITHVNQQPVTALSAEDLPAVRRTIAFLPRNVVATFTIDRDGETLNVELEPRKKGSVEGEELDCPRWDMTVKAINQFDNEELYFHRKEGVFVYGVKYPGNAGSAGLWDNDIILTIDGTDVKTLDDIRAIHKRTIDNVETKHKIVFVVLRNGLMRHVVLDFSRDYSKH